MIDTLLTLRYTHRGNIPMEKHVSVNDTFRFFLGYMKNKKKNNTIIDFNIDSVDSMIESFIKNRSFYIAEANGFKYYNDNDLEGFNLDDLTAIQAEVVDRIREYYKSTHTASAQIA